LRDGGSAVRDADGPGANVATLDARVVDARLTELVASLGQIHPLACCAGAAGAEVPAARARLESLLERLLPDCRVSVVHDARLVLAAAGIDAGIALIAGTGSVAYGRGEDGREVQRGGWGWMVGDEGSGVWATREAVRLIMSRAEAEEPLGELGTALLSATGARDPRELVRELHALREPMQWAALSSLIFDSADGDSGARDLIQRAAFELARLVEMVRRDLGISGPVVLAGGLLLHQPRLESAVRAEIGDCLRLEEPPVEGAVRLAEELLHG
jgi:N-acetylglucosamine kinase-like BadF-type ATPase